MSLNLPHEIIRESVKLALIEDIGTGDLTAELIPARTHSRAYVVCKEQAIVCGQAWFNETFRQLDPAVEITWHCREGAAVEPDTRLCSLSGPARPILTGERTALNFLQTLSATATRTRRYVDAVDGTPANILDTRKTLPGLRLAQKYAVSCGGGMNHRLGLYDAILIKENHIMAAGSIARAVTQARAQPGNVQVEVETETLDEVRQALEAGADVIMLDEFNLEGMREAVALVAGRCKLEASGGVDLSRIREIAKTGVNFISVGALTKHIQAVDLSLRLEA
ncbi:carboxylating nicotinate-nucleotide diphosphorylase [Ectothiorhodospira lacustris]|uniref:carboxylating nicotinate-nucleotide diphosphorylase n=1 Tax=Ectothiorhodospira lacustris TaxID=2899127 RepID=UPI001EE9A763|nr:carboxylating nicotinate-nucleotide diphosphorylase [Ectothiorhodospira lacustris]MCG5508789.1 carboxylating nicotinate-nucleotide diphosphorylase [Ectothiorhodospira lacustris]MCG5520580.1 carboxylating nicotinate-nucleotide diphosphorylase [Ectothiorhodospira lacustris]